MPLVNRAGGGGVSFTAFIRVTYTPNSVCTCEKSGIVYTATDTTGSYTFKVKSAGTWTIKVVQGTYSKSVNVEITEDTQVKDVLVKLWSVCTISRDITAEAPEWARSDDAEGLTAVASVGTQAGHSDFDALSPWSDIARETLSTGDVMVKIPKFYYRRYRDGNIEYISISSRAIANYSVHPAFVYNGVEKDHIYVGAYLSGKTCTSLSGQKPQTESWENAHDTTVIKGAGWDNMTIDVLSALQMLILVEFATNNILEAIGGRAGSSAPTGLCDDVPNLTGKSTGETYNSVWRGIECFWKVSEWLYGVYYYDDYNAKYRIYDSWDTKYSAYTDLSYTWGGASSGYMLNVGLDSTYSHIMLNGEVGTGASTTTYMCSKADYKRTNLANAPMCFGTDGLFSRSVQVTNVWKRLIYIPQ